MRSWEVRYGRLPTSYDWSSTHARRRGGDALARLAQGEWPAASVVTRLFGTWSVARAVAAQRAGEMTGEPAPASSSFGRESISLPKPRESTAKTENLRGGEPPPEFIAICRYFLQRHQIWPIIRVGEVPRFKSGRPNLGKPCYGGAFCCVRRACRVAWGWESPVAEMALTTSRGQLLRREAWWEGSRRRNP